MAQRVMIVAVFVAGRDRVNALRQHRRLIVLNLRRLTRIPQAIGQRRGQPRLSIDLAQRQQPAIADQPPAAEVRLDPPPSLRCEPHRIRVTLCHVDGLGCG